MDLFDVFEKIIPPFDKLQTWAKYVWSGWVFYTAVAIVSLLFGREKNDTTDELLDKPLPDYIKTWEMTGDERIDKALTILNALERSSGGKVRQVDLVKTLKPLFNRPAFYGIREENWEYFLFPLCQTRMILEYYQENFKSADDRSKIKAAIEKMVVLQNDIDAIYGTAFTITEHIDKFINSKDDFISELPNQVITPNQAFFNARDAAVLEIRTLLKPIGLAD
jgi:hypothetical protein